MCKPIIGFLLHLLCTICITQLLYSEENDTLSKSGFYVLPFATYAPETKLAIGIAGIYYFRQSGDSTLRPSSINCGILYSTMNQIGTGIYPDMYFDNDNVRVQGLYEYYRYPDSFFGIGGNTLQEHRERFTPVGFKSQTSLYYNLNRKKVRNGFNIGIRAEARYDDITEQTTRENGEPGLLQQQSVNGSNGGYTIGLGPLLNIDSRDNIFASEKGIFLNLYALHFGSILGSDFQFNSFNSDFRIFETIASNTILAFQTLTTFNFGSPPFYSLARLGGTFQMRGIFDGKYRDNHSAIMQTELRFPLVWRLRCTLFTSLGSVSAAIGTLTHTIKIAYGGGIRFLLSEKEKLSVRFDVGFGDAPQFYVGIAEAF